GDSLSGQFRSGAGSDGDVKPQRDGVVNKRKDIFTAQRISSGKDQMRKGLSEGKQLSKKRFAFKGRELLGMCVRDGLRSTVFAGQATSLGHFPVDEHRISGKIK